jgi:hypothetical protein
MITYPCSQPFFIHSSHLTTNKPITPKQQQSGIRSHLIIVHPRLVGLRLCIYPPSFPTKPVALWSYPLHNCPQCMARPTPFSPYNVENKGSFRFGALIRGRNPRNRNRRGTNLARAQPVSRHAKHRAWPKHTKYKYAHQYAQQQKQIELVFTHNHQSPFIPKRFNAQIEGIRY